MNQRGNRNPALVELILVLLFFALSSVILVQVFVKAHFTSEESRAQTLGLLKAQDVIERWKENPGEPEAVFTPEDGWKETAGESGDARTFLMSCTGELEPAGDGQEAYEMRSELWTEEPEAGSLYHIRVQVIGLRDQKIQVELATSRYQAEK